MIKILESSRISNLSEIRSEISHLNLVSSLLYSIIRRMVKYDLKYKYNHAFTVKATKNTDINKIYRRYISKEVFKVLPSYEILISIDETNFSSFTKKSRV